MKMTVKEMEALLFIVCGVSVAASGIRKNKITRKLRKSMEGNNIAKYERFISSHDIMLSDSSAAVGKGEADASGAADHHEVGGGDIAAL